MNSLLSTLFDIQMKIEDVLPSDYSIVDAGMFTDVNSPEHWRDCCIRCSYDGKEYSFSYSNLGNIKGEVPPRLQMVIAQILNPYREVD